MDEFLSNVFYSILIGIFIGIVLIWLLMEPLVEKEWQKELIERDLGLYCPVDGKWAFKGECEVK